ncbi:MAG TPA: hypothetical protein VMP11_04715, partial [Verrucomicrobiae bacterium]|nr:hypothetical protein [Verrucomicrobiae bacterium]
FNASDSGWLAVDGRQIFEQTIAKRMSWTVTFRGTALGPLFSIDPETPAADEWFVRDRVLDLVPGQQIPRVGNSTGGFGGWCDPPRDRPLVLTTGLAFKDPVGWAVIVPGLALIDSLLPAFKRATGAAFTCLADGVQTVPFPYSVRDLRLVGAYRNRAGRTLIGVEIDPAKNSCDGQPGIGFRPHWFLMEPVPVQIGEDLELVDIGDYNGDGASDFIFLHSTYDEDGYTLFSDDFKKRLEVRWIYH